MPEGGPSPVVPSQFNAPKPNGATAPVTPAPEVVKPPVAQAAPSEVESLRARLAEAERREVTEKKTRITETRQWQREKQTFSEKLKAADAYERLKRTASVNKMAAAKELFGEKWHEELNMQAANGGAPTAESIALEMERTEERALEKFKAQQAEERKAQQEAADRQTQQRLAAHTSQAVEFAKSTAAEYPIFEQFKSPERAAGAIVQRQRDVYESTTKRDPETGQVLVSGRVMTFKEAADAVEADLEEIAATAVKYPKYADKLRSKLTAPAAVGTVPVASSSSQSQQQQAQQKQSEGRRSLSNDMTGSNLASAAPTFETDEQRRERSIKKYYEALESKGKA